MREIIPTRFAVAATLFVCLFAGNARAEIPEPQARAEAEFPELALYSNQEGVVVISFDISQRGRLSGIEIECVDPPGYGFETSAKDAVRRWRYKPSAVAHENISVFFYFHIVDQAVHKGTTSSATELPMDRSPQNPVPACRMPPDYPKSAFHDSISGTVSLTIDIDKEGRVSRAEVVNVSVPGYGFEENALKAVRHWRYPPYQGARNNVKVDVNFRTW